MIALEFKVCQSRAKQRDALQPQQDRCAHANHLTLNLKPSGKLAANAICTHNMQDLHHVGSDLTYRASLSGLQDQL